MYLFINVDRKGFKIINGIDQSIFMKSICVSGVELVIEFLEYLQFFFKETFRKDQSGNPEVVSTWNLSKTASWNDDYSCVLQHLNAVEHINFLAEFFGSLDCLL